MAGSRPLVIGHRGAPGYRPEHTRSSYELAITQGAEAVEPDVVFSSDGVALVRHENEIGSTTDVAERAEFAHRRTSKMVDGVVHEGWFTEDFTWEELATLRCRERLPQLRPASAALDGAEPLLRLRDVLDLVGQAADEREGGLGVVLEIKHATYFEALGFDVAALVGEELRAAGWPGPSRPLIIESFEPSILHRLREHGVPARLVLLYEEEGSPFDLVSALGAEAPTYRDLARPESLASLSRVLDGISVDKNMVLAPASRVVADAHAHGLTVYVWTCRPENVFLDERFRRGADPAGIGDYAGEWDLIASTGVDGVFFDHPDLAMRVFQNH